MSWARRRENFVVSDHPWSERCPDVGRGKRIGNSDRRKCGNGSCDASGHSPNAARSTVYSADDPCGRRIVRHPGGLWIWKRSGSLAASAKLVELQGAVERLEDLMRRYTQRRDARNGQRYMLAEDIRMAALEALLPEELERHCQLQRSRLDTYQKLREEVVLYAEARGYVAPNLGQVSKAREDRDDSMDVGGFGQGKGRTFSKQKGRTSLALAEEREQEKMVRHHRNERTRRRFKVSVGIAGKQVTNTRTAG